MKTMATINKTIPYIHAYLAVEIIALNQYLFPLNLGRIFYTLNRILGGQLQLINLTSYQLLILSAFYIQYYYGNNQDYYANNNWNNYYYQIL